MKLEMNDMQLLLVLLILPIAAFAVTANNAYGLTPMVGCEWWGCGDGVVLARDFEGLVMRGEDLRALQ